MAPRAPLRTLFPHRGAAAVVLAAALAACAPRLTINPIGPLRVTGFGLVSQLVRVSNGRAPVPGLTRERFELLEDGRPVSGSESDAHIELRGQAFRLYTVLLLDVSGSMREHLPEVREAARSFVTRLFEATAAPDTQRVAVYVFSGSEAIFPLLYDEGTDPFGNPRRRGRASADQAELARAIDTLSCDPAAQNAYCADRSTNLYGATIAAVREMREFELQGEREGIAHLAGSVVVFTDGTDRARRVSRLAVDDALRRLRDNEHVFTIGLGSEIDEAALRAIGRDGFVPATAFVSLGGAFLEVATRLSAVANSYYLLRYCSPSRHGQPVRLTLVARDAEDHRGSVDFTFTSSTSGERCEVAHAPPTPGSSPPPAGSTEAPAAP